MRTWRIILANLAGILAAFALIAQLSIVVERNAHDAAALLGGLNNFFSFFTVLTNLLVLLVVASPLIRRISRAGEWLGRFRVKSAVLTYIALVGITNAILLRHLVNLRGLEAILERIFHDAVPVVYFVYWVFLPGRQPIRWKDLLWWTAYPAVYLIYVLIRGRLIDRYPYPFMNVDELGFPAVIGNAAGMALAVLVLGLLVMGLNASLVQFLTRKHDFLSETAKN